MKIVLNNFSEHARISQHSNLNIYIICIQGFTKTYYNVPSIYIYQLISLCVACMHIRTHPHTRTTHTHIHTTHTHTHTHRLTNTGSQTHTHTGTNTQAWTHVHPHTPQHTCAHTSASFTNLAFSKQKWWQTNCFCQTFGEASDQFIVYNTVQNLLK